MSNSILYLIYDWLCIPATICILMSRECAYVQDVDIPGLLERSKLIPTVVCMSMHNIYYGLYSNVDNIVRKLILIDSCEIDNIICDGFRCYGSSNTLHGRFR